MSKTKNVVGLILTIIMIIICTVLVTATITKATTATETTTTETTATETTATETTTTESIGGVVFVEIFLTAVAIVFIWFAIVLSDFIGTEIKVQIRY